MVKKIKNDFIVFSIETSCDETSAAVLRENRGRFELLANVVSSQIKIHQKFGGVVPEIAARHHVENIIPVVDEALETAGIKPAEIDLMAVVSGPGLVTSLMVGVETAKTLAFSWRKPLISVNHMYAHMAANFLPHLRGGAAEQQRGFPPLVSRGGAQKEQRGLEINFIPDRPPAPSLRQGGGDITFPAICLVVSGGHTEIIHLRDYWRYQKIGQTLDDAAGEAFDKVAKLLGLGYPGGPAVSAEAEKFFSEIISPPCLKEGIKGRSKDKNFLRPHPNPPLETRGGRTRIGFPRPMMNSGDYNFSFSGLKTAVLYTAQKMTKSERKKRTPEICAEFQQAATDVLVAKTIRAAKEYGAKTVLLAGGVAANKKLRESLALAVSNLGLTFLVPPFNLCTDNAAMVAIASYYLSKKNKTKIDNWKKIKVNPNWELT